MFLVLTGPTLSAQDLPVYHAVVSSTRTYMDASRNTKSDYWFTKDKTYISNGRVATIERKDMGVVYTLIVKSNEYYVDTIKPSKKEVPEVRELDFRHIGVDRYTTDYEWTINRKSGKDTAGLFSSVHYLADGDADFDQISLEYWISKPDDRQMARLLNEIMITNSRNLKSRKPLVDHLRKNKYEIPSKIIELIDNPIAPPILNRIVVEKLEPAKAPENISDKTRLAYILDVIVDDRYRKQGIGQAMIRYILDHPELKDVYKWVLITKDAHEVYKKVGFNPISRPDDCMEIKHTRPDRSEW